MIELLRIYDLGEAEIIEVELNWTEHVLRMLTHPVVTSILLAVAMFGLIAEVRTPGWGLGGTLALVALGLFFGSHLIVHLAEWQELALFAVGVTLLVVELVAIPGFGIVGVLGIAAMIASVVITQLGDFQLWSFRGNRLGDRASRWLDDRVRLLLSLIVLRSLPKFAAFNRLVLHNEIKAADGYTSSSRKTDEELLGKEGVTVSYLRPSGIALLGGKRLTVIAEGEFIEAQRPIKVVEARGSRVVVRAL